MWLPSVEASVRPSTFRSYRMHCEVYVVPRLGTIRLQNLSPDSIGAMYRDLLDDGKVHRAKPRIKDGEEAAPAEPLKRGLSPLTVRHTHAVLHRALRDAVKRQYLHRNPADAVDPPKVNDVHEMQVWTAEQAKAFLEATGSDRLNPLWRLMVDRGLRRSEACGLRWEDVDLEAGRLSVRRALVASGKALHVSEPKTKKGRRVLPLNAATVAALRQQAAQQADDAQEWSDTWADSGFVFTAQDGQPLHPARVSSLFDDAQKRAQVPRIRLHDLRHTCAVLHLKAGVHVKVVQELLGHATIAVTMDTYSHVLPGMQEEAAERIAELLAP
jgi:integrase